ncbi:MAG: cellulase family glycosylhydrolase [Bacteroidales bacterium]|nr:cellulase family glycosylhydrolase [Bacteroidales bacterium]
MKIRPLLVVSCLLAILLAACAGNYPPISLHPKNPHYFLFRGKPAVLIGSTEHYGAVLNLDFDYISYFNELASNHLNVTRTFSGIYLEPQGAFGIEKNTLAPESNRYICPWARSNQIGYAHGGNKFDLDQWDEAYFERLKDFITEAGKRDIVVELDLFSNFYDTLQWKLCPLYIANNVNQIGDFLDQKEVLSLRHPEILEIQEKMVRKIVETLKDFDNLYYEVCNEPYFGDLEALEAWEQHMTGVIADAEKDFRHKHLISQNIANHSLLIESPNPLVSVFNFHYARPPVTVAMNYHLNKVIGDNETGFDGTEDVTYRREAWNFMLAGGALFNNLDYSFTIDHENGSFPIPAKQPGGGGPDLRAQLQILKDVLEETDFIHMVPMDSINRDIHKDRQIEVLAREGEQYLFYLTREGQRIKCCAVSPEIPAGDYTGEWIDTKTGKRTMFDLKAHPGGIKSFTTPPFSEDIALKLTRKRR